MKTISIINLKGGVGKTVSAINIAYLLASEHGQRVLLIDNDKQGNTTKFFDLHSYDDPSIAEVLTVKGCTIAAAIKRTQYDGLDLLPANMNLIHANMQILMDVTTQQQTRLAKALRTIAGDYDYCIIDNAPDVNMTTINALVASDEVLIPIKLDRFSLDGLEQLAEQVESVKDFNPCIKIAGCFVTVYQPSISSKQSLELLRRSVDFPVFKTIISKTVKVDEHTFTGKPLQIYSPTCTAARDYAALVSEYLKK